MQSNDKNAQYSDATHKADLHLLIVDPATTTTSLLFDDDVEILPTSLFRVYAFYAVTTAYLVILSSYCL